MFLKKFLFGETAVYYAECPVEGHENKTVIGLAIYPERAEIEPEKLCLDSLVQVAFTGDEGLVDYTSGVTMRNRSSTLLKVEQQTADGRGVVTRLTDGTGNYYLHTLEYCAETGVFTLGVKYENRTGKAQTLEMLSSFSLSGIKAQGKKDTTGLSLHRMTSAWSRECRLKSEPFSAIGQDASWARYGVKCERWGQVGSMPNRGYYPFAAIEDGSGNVWGVQIEAPYSWQLELYKEKETCAISGGLADFEFGHWRKTVENGEAFETHKAFLAVRQGGGVNAVCNALVRHADKRLCVSESEESMPVLFNEYCTTWGEPSAKNIGGILEAIKGLPIAYFVIDAGWYKPEDKGWCNAIGDWKESKELFPNGLKEVSAQIKKAGMKAGIWFEFEVAGRDSELFSREELLLTRGGKVVTCKNRRFLDLRKAEVEEYLNDKMLRSLKENGFEYLKIDYNDAYGVGCDGAESPGEGGRQVAEESIAWLSSLKREIGEIVIENCSSGGSRIEPLRMNNSAMCSFSDAHECPEIPLVAANVSRVIPARQMQIWAVLRDNEMPSRTIYSLCAAFMGRICLSGDVINLTEDRKALILSGLNFYEAVKDVVRYGEITQIDCDVEYYREPAGRQVYEKEYRGRRLIIVHFLESESAVKIPLGSFSVKAAYTDLTYEADGGVLRIYGEPFHAGAFLLENRNG